MSKFIIRTARGPESREFLDLEFNIRPGSYSTKWKECIQSVAGKTPYQHGFPKFLEADPSVYEQRILEAIEQDQDIQDFVGNFTAIDQQVVNTVHRFIEHNKAKAAEHLELHNNIHYLESIWKGANEVVFKKLQWVPPGTLIDMTLDDYKEFTTEPCTNFIQDDFSHVGRSPHNSFLYGDDTSLYTSCVIQHKVGSGVKWFLPDDSHIFNDKLAFQDWVAQHQEFFRTQWAIETTTDPRLCMGRIIIAEGAEDYSKMDRTFDYITEAFISE
jgi:hypothetical protein